MALAAGSEHMNLLAEAGGTAAPSGGSAASAGADGERMHEYAAAGWIRRRARGLSAGDIVAVDVDYAGADGVCRDGRKRGVCNVGGERGQQCGLHPPRDVECGARGSAAGCFAGNAVDAGVAAGGRSAGGGLRSAGGDRICGSRGRELLSRVVGAVCGGGRAGRLGVFPLSAAAGDGGGGRKRRQRWRARWSGCTWARNFAHFRLQIAMTGRRCLCFRSYLPGANTLV